MKRNKWQGIACFLLASLMVSSSFAAPMRNEKPTSPVPSQTATPSPAPTVTPSPSETQKPSVTQKTSVTPSTSKTTPAPTKPVQETTPALTKPMTKPSPTPTVPAPKPCPVPGNPVEKPEVKPCQPCQPIEKPNASVQKPAKPDQPVEKPNLPINKPGAMPCKPAEKPNALTAPTNKPNASSSKSCGLEQKPGQKPFMLDHFKMIVNALKKLGVEEKQIVTYIKEGKKLEDILKAEKIKPKKFKKCILKEYNKVVDEAQKKGQITCEQSKQLKSAIKETINNWLPAASK